MSTPGVFMRRRQANAHAAAMRIGPAKPVVAPIAVQWAEPPANQCAKCGRTFKAKVVPHFHARACKGR